MNAVGLWIGVPFLVAGGLWLTGTSRRIAAIVLAVLFGWLTLVAYWVPPGHTITLRGTVLFMQPDFTWLGRTISLPTTTGGLLLAWCLSGMLWEAGLASLEEAVPRALPSGAALLLVGMLLVWQLSSLPLGLVGLGGLLAFSVTLAALTGAGAADALRLTAQVLWAVLILLFAWFVMAGGEAVPLSPVVRRQAILLFSAGWVLLLSAPPFLGPWLRTWESAPPYLSALLGWGWGQGVTLWVLIWLARMPWLGSPAPMLQAAHLEGALLVAITGLAAAITDRPARWMAAASLTLIGWGWFALGSAEVPAWSRFLTLWWPHLLALWGLGISLHRLQSAAQPAERPLATFTALIAMLTLAGTPFLAAFPPRLGIFLAVSPGAALWLVSLGSIAWLAPAIRLFRALFPFAWQDLRRDSGLVWLPAVLILAGWMPHLLVPFWQPLQAFFPMFP